MKDIDGFVTKDAIYRLLSNLKPEVDEAILRKISQAVADMPCEPEPDDSWIKVWRELPESDETVLVYGECTSLLNFSATIKMFALGRIHNNRWQFVNDTLHSQDMRVTDWRPLPKPPKGG